MGFLNKLKKTLLNSFFGKKERPIKVWKLPKKKKRPAKKKKAPKKSGTANFRLRQPAKKKLPAKKKSLKTTALPKTPRFSNVSQKPRLPKATAAHFYPVKSALKVSLPIAEGRKPQGVLTGHVTHFFAQVKVAAIKIEAQHLAVGDEIYIKGATTGFKTKIDSMQINRVPVTQAPKGSEIGILVKKRVREGDEVFKL